MDSRSIGADLSFAWPTNEIAAMGAEGAANVVFRREIAASDDPDATRARLIKEYKAELMHPYYAAERGLVDDVIDLAETRTVLDPLPGHAPHQERPPPGAQAGTSRPTTNRPMRRETDTSTVGGEASRSLIAARSSGDRPIPVSWISISTRPSGRA
ncbi:hypothetical protein SGLAM104S_03406 [Streptomyces glaucescens]